MYALFKDGKRYFESNPFATLKVTWEFAQILNAIEWYEDCIRLKEGYTIEEVKE